MAQQYRPLTVPQYVPPAAPAWRHPAVMQAVLYHAERARLASLGGDTTPGGSVDVLVDDDAPTVGLLDDNGSTFLTDG